MSTSEFVADEVAFRLAAIGIRADRTKSGPHWQVEVAPVGARSLVVTCYWYEGMTSGLMLGMNAGNSRNELARPVRAPYEGPEHYVTLRQDGANVASGRTRRAAEVVACARGWLDGASRSDLERALPFIDESPRRLRAIADRLDPRLRREVDPEGRDDLWVYGDGRSCEITAVESTVACAFRVGQAKVAQALDPADLPAAVAAWLVDRVPVPELARVVPGAHLARHAEVVEVDPARWHWLHVRDRLADPDDVLAPLAPLIAALATSETATRFYTYSSLASLCFSASSHYPWVDVGVGRIEREPEGLFWFGTMRGSLSQALEWIESALAAAPVRPFFGSGPDHDAPLLAACLERHGSTLRPRVLQRGAWSRIRVAKGGLSCDVQGTHVGFEDTTTHVGVSYESLDDAARALTRFLEAGATLDELETDPRATYVSKRRPRS
jgi:hypothetical protein